MGREHSKKEGDDCAGVTNQDRLIQLLPDFSEVQFHSDGEHEQYQSELAQYRDVSQ